MADNNSIAPKDAVSKPSAVDLLNSFLTENQIEIRLSPFRTKQVDDGSLVIDSQQLIVGFANETPPIATTN